MLPGSKMQKLIFSILTQEMPMKIPEIQRKLLKTYGIKISYQGVLKQLLRLCRHGIVIKDCTYYYINPKWLITVKTTAESCLKKLEKMQQEKEKIERLAKAIGLRENTKNITNKILKETLKATLK